MKIVPEGFWEWWKEKGKAITERELTWCMIIATGLILALIGGYFIFNH